MSSKELTTSEMPLSQQQALQHKLILLERLKPNYDNLRYIAISNLRTENERTLRAWWHRKYRVPPKPIDDYVFEELMIEYFEDFYFENPEKAEEFFKSMVKTESIGNDDFEVPNHVKKILSKRKAEVDITKYQTEGDKDLTDEECQAIFDSIKGIRQKKYDDDEFDDNYAET